MILRRHRAGSGTGVVVWIGDYTCGVDHMGVFCIAYGFDLHEDFRAGNNERGPFLPISTETSSRDHLLWVELKVFGNKVAVEIVITTKEICLLAYKRGEIVLFLVDGADRKNDQFG